MDLLEITAVLAVFGSVHLLVVAGYAVRIARTVMAHRTAERAYRARLALWSRGT